jgi:hypothetical protein
VVMKTSEQIHVDGCYGARRELLAVHILSERWRGWFLPPAAVSGSLGVCCPCLSEAYTTSFHVLREVLRQDPGEIRALRAAVKK